MNSDNMIPELNWPFMQEMREFTLPVFPGRENNTGSLRMEKVFPDPEGLLESAYEGVKRLADAAGLPVRPDGKYLLKTEQVETSIFEEYNLTVTPEQCLVSAADTEGIRRGIYEFLDMLSSRNGLLPDHAETITRKPWLRNRLGRCPFSPIKRAPVNTDELLDEIDYYPDAYLETLAKDAVNGIWIVTSLRELGTSSFITPDPLRETRLSKLAKVVEKCRRYGVKVWIFMIEPFAVDKEDPLFQKHPELFVKEVPETGRICFCPASSATQQFLRDSLQSIFSAVPRLGGVLDIVYGERPTTCLSMVESMVEKKIPCLDQCGMKNGEMIRLSLQAMIDGIHAGSPSAELIAWFYMPYPEKLASWTEKLAEYVPDNVTAQFNFESGGSKEQLGKTRTCGDYWVSYTGPADRFRDAALLRKGKPMGAKLQLGAGHELTVVPYIPAPGIAWRKYRAMKELGVSSVMHSWYIGNFPGLMETAMGRLAFEPFPETEKDFLSALLKPLWREDAPMLRKAMQIFDEAYQNFPFSLMFQYYGPQNSFPLWQLHFLPLLKPLAPPWKPNFTIGGDAIGEALSGITIEDALTLVKTISLRWNEGLFLLAPLRERKELSREQARDLQMMEFLGKIFDGTRNILQFFVYRRDLFLGRGDTQKNINGMMRILDLQKELCRFLIPLLGNDSRLGFHGEALTRIFDEKKIRQSLEEMDFLPGEAGELRRAYLKGTSPMEYACRNLFTIIENEKINRFGTHVWRCTIRNGRITIWFRSRAPKFALFVFFMDLTGCRYPFIEYVNVEDAVVTYGDNNQALVTGEKFDSGLQTSFAVGSLELSWPLESFPWMAEEGYLRVNLEEVTPHNKSFAYGEELSGRLMLWSFRPEDSAVMEVPPEARTGSVR